MSSNAKENKMGVKPIKSLLITMSLPMMVSMLVQALYNIVDSIFVAKIGENALTAVSLAFPVQNLMISVATGTAIGINSLVSRFLGAKDHKQVESVAMNGIFLAILSYIFFALFGLFFCGVFFRSQTDITEIVNYGKQYLFVCTIFSMGMFGQITFERLLLSTGKTMLSMTSQIIGAITNVILDPILIFGLFGIPAMGVAGAAIATCIGQCVACVVAIVLNLKFNHEIKLQIKDFRPSFRIIRKIYSIGLPSIIMMSITSIMVFGLNKVLMVFSATATAVLGIYFKLQSFVFMPVFGLNNGMVPILAYNFGARQKKRMTDTIKNAITYAMCIMLLGLIIFQTCSKDFLLPMFNASDDMIKIGVIALRLISLSFVFAGFCIVSSSVFQALGHGVLSMIVSIVRQLLVLLPVAYLLSLTGNIDLVWLSFPIAEIFSVTLCTIFLIKVYKNTIAVL